MTGPQRLLLDLRAVRSAPRDYREFVEEMRGEADHAFAVSMPLTGRHIANLCRITDRAARAEVDDPEPDPEGAPPCGCDDCVTYMWRQA